MSAAALGYIATMMREIGVPYRYERWKSEELPDDYYCVGESYTEIPLLTKEEDGRHETTLYLRLFTRREWLLLEQAKDLIESHCARTAILDDGTGIAVFYDSAMIVPTGDAELKSMKINLTIQEWKVK